MLDRHRTIQANRAFVDHPNQDEIRQRIQVVCETGHHELILRKRDLKSTPPDILKCRFVRRLRLHSNELKTFPMILLALPMLSELDLNTNQITTVPDSISQFTHLQSLDLSNNRIRLLPVKEVRPAKISL
jgi:Leucine-rich repeat (LRR) protein